MTKKNKTLIMLSGGLDSTTALAKAIKEGYTVKAIFFNFGQENSKRELAAARRVSMHYDIDLEVVNMEGISENFLGLSQGINIGIGFTSLTGEKSQNCPHALFGLASTFAILKGFDKVINGINSVDYESAPTIKDYVKSYSELINKFEKGNFTFETPFLEISKSEVVKLGQTLEIPFKITRSCMRNQENHCGECSACRERKDAFTKAGILDTTTYIKKTNR
ncbi:7-cyano-7-deazaguanine synthase [Flavobacterium sp.]|jgi:7-cyano-7-deazaguanine synthase|uniref:7-cyano-7-deazaguanine synthase n=1 Tax=Flavobacterium sp. TaxID=239 RepID=UPI0037C0C809